MPTIERRINALGGVANSSSDYDVAHNEGRSEALTSAMEIGADADAQIEELIEFIEDMLDGKYRNLEDWTLNARRVVNHINWDRSH